MLLDVGRNIRLADATLLRMITSFIILYLPSLNEAEFRVSYKPV